MKNKATVKVGLFNDGNVKIVHKIHYLGTPDEIYIEESRYDVKKIGPFKTWTLTGRDLLFLPVYAFSALEAIFNEGNNKELKQFRNGELQRYRKLYKRQVRELDAMSTEDIFHEVGKDRFAKELDVAMDKTEFDLGRPTVVHNSIAKYFVDQGTEFICKQRNGLTYDFTFMQQLSQDKHVKIFQVTALGNEHMLQLANVCSVTIDEETARNIITEVNQQRSVFLDK